MPKLLRRFPNLYGELSDAYLVLKCDHEYAGKFLTEFQDKLFFGTDICSFRHHFGMRELLLELRDSGRISETVFGKIARENAIRFFDL